MNLIAAIDRSYGIGREGGLLYHIPEDMKLFKQLTTGKAVVMGRSTLLSLPRSKPLPNRANIVLSQNPDFEVEGAVLCRSLEDFLATASRYPTDDIFVIGGEAIYELLHPYCRKAYLTRIEGESPADKHFFRIDDCPGWSLTEQSEPQEHQGLLYRFTQYSNASPLPLK